MIIGDVVGTVWATRKEDNLNGLKLLVVVPKYDPVLARSFVAVDLSSAGIGDTVLVTKGSSARRAISKEDSPIDAVIVGIVDTVDIADGIE